MSEARDDPAVDDGKDRPLGFHRGVGGLIEDAQLSFGAARLNPIQAGANNPSVYQLRLGERNIVCTMDHLSLSETPYPLRQVRLPGTGPAAFLRCVPDDGPRTCSPRPR